MAQLFTNLGAKLEIWYASAPCSYLFNELMQVKFE
jgi:hypothetical protein